MSEISELFERCVSMHRSGEYAVAAQGYAAILRADPNHADAWHLSGLLAHQSGRSADGLGYIQRAIELNPYQAEYYSNIAAIQTSLGQWLHAIAAADRAIAIEPKNAVAQFQKGRALARLGLADAAMMALTAARQNGFYPAVVLSEIGGVLQSTGRIDKSVAAFEESLKINPSQPSVWLALARLISTRQYEFSETQLKQMTTMLQQSSSDKDCARVAFSLASHFDRVGDSDHAFELWRMGNECSQRFLGQQGHSYNPDVRTQRINRRKKVFSQEFVRSLKPVSDSRRPIVVVGMPRSGTSLVEQILASHPNVAAGGELSYWSDVVETHLGVKDPSEQASVITTEWRTSAAEGYDRLLLSISSDADRVVDKMPGNYMHVGLIATALPNATVIHCQRDPRDTCLSCYSQLFDDPQLQLSTSDLLWLAQQYQDYAGLMRHWNAVLPGRIVEIRYEQLVQCPETEVRRLLEQCGLSWSAECLNFHSSQKTVHTASVVQVRQPFYKSSQGRWVRSKTHLQPLIDKLAGDILADNILADNILADNILADNIDDSAGEV